MNSIWDGNIEALAGKNRALVYKLQVFKSANVEFIVGKNNFYTAKYNNILVNSMYEPMKEAVARVDAVKDIEKANILICAGFGLGYEMNEILRRVNNRCLVLLVIPDLELFAKVMETIDLSNILKFQRLIIMDVTVSNFKKYFQENYFSLIYFTLNVNYFIHPVVERFFKREVENSIKEIKEGIIYVSSAVGNSPADTLEGVVNIIQNIPAIIKTSDLKSLKGRFKGIPAICVASGPSLNKNIHVLKKAQGRAAIFASESIMQRLRDEGIRFDAVSVLERTPDIYENFFQKMPLEEDVVLFGECLINSGIFKGHKGSNVTVFRSTTGEKYFSGPLNDLNELRAGISVANMNFSIANYLGFSPIILVGQDLAYGDDDQSHAKGTIRENKNIESDIEEGLAEEILYVKGVNGGQVKTMRTWKRFLDWFEIEIKNQEVLCIDASEGGALINGTVVMPLEDAIEKYCPGGINIDFKSYFTQTPADEQIERKKILKKMIENEIEEFENANKLINENLKHLSKFKRMVIKNGNNFNINKYIKPVNDNTYKFFKFKMFMYIVQTIFINLGRRLNDMVEIKTLEDCNKWHDIQYGFMKDIQGHLEISKKLFKCGLEEIDTIQEG